MKVRRGSEWARWGLLATALALGVALIATTWASHRAIVRASSQLAHSQGEALFDSIRRDLGRIQKPPASSDLTTAFDRHRDSGLLHVAIVDRRGNALVSGGKRTFSRAEGESESGVDTGRRWTRQGDFYRLVAPFDEPPGGPGPKGPNPDHRGPRRPQLSDPSPGEVPREGRRPPPRGGPERGPRGGGPRRGGPPRHFLLIEFEASTPRELAQRTTGTLVAGTASAGLLMVAALLFWNQARARERTQRQLEQQKRLSALGEMSAVLAHEIRNPLASLKGHAQLLAEQIAGDHPQGRKVQRIVDEASRLERLTTDLLEFVRTGAIRLSRTDPVALVKDLCEGADRERIRIRSEAAPALWPLDRERLRQVMENLLRNALQASPPEATVEVEVSTVKSPAGETLRLLVRDHGPGLPSGREENIFEPFVTTRTQGTGLGLAVARRIVELHGGTLVGRTHPQGGAELEVKIPRT